MFEKLFSAVEYIASKITVVFDYLVSSITSPKNLIATSFAFGVSIDALLVGKLGFIYFLFGSLQMALALVVSGGWQLVTIVALVVMYLSKK